MKKYKNLPKHCYNAGEPYKNYAELSLQNDNQLIIDIGTYRGFSAFSFASNKKNKVHTFDITDYIEIELPENVEFHLKDGLDIPNELLNKANIILLDVDPHDGIQEYPILDHIIKSGFRGLLIVDDVNLNDGMKSFYNSIKYEKEIVYWHHSGTGLVKIN